MNAFTIFPFSHLSSLSDTINTHAGIYTHCGEKKKNFQFHPNTISNSVHDLVPKTQLLQKKKKKKKSSVWSLTEANFRLVRTASSPLNLVFTQSSSFYKDTLGVFK